jgi:hypothetical protein
LAQVRRYLHRPCAFGLCAEGKDGGRSISKEETFAGEHGYWAGSADLAILPVGIRTSAG